MMYCKNCGKELKEGSSFCSNCGLPLNNSIYIKTQEITSNSNAEQVKNDLPVTSPETESKEESKEKWSTAEIIGAVCTGIPALILTFIFIKLKAIPSLSDDLGIITFLPYCLLCLFLSLSIMGIPLTIVMMIYYGIKNNYEKVKGELIGYIFCHVLGIISLVCLISSTAFWIVLIIAIIAGVIVEKMGILDDKKENKE